MEDKNKKRAALARRIEMIVFGFMFFIIIVLATSASKNMVFENYFAMSFLLTISFAYITGKDYLYKMPPFVSTGTIIGVAISGNLSISAFAAIILGSIACLVFILAVVKLNEYKYEIKSASDAADKERK